MAHCTVGKLSSIPEHTPPTGESYMISTSYGLARFLRVVKVGLYVVPGRKRRDTHGEGDEFTPCAGHPVAERCLGGRNNYRVHGPHAVDDRSYRFDDHHGGFFRTRFDGSGTERIHHQWQHLRRRLDGCCCTRRRLHDLEYCRRHDRVRWRLGFVAQRRGAGHRVCFDLRRGGNGGGSFRGAQLLHWPVFRVYLYQRVLERVFRWRNSGTSWGPRDLQSRQPELCASQE